MSKTTRILLIVAIAANAINIVVQVCAVIWPHCWLHNSPF